MFAESSRNNSVRCGYSKMSASCGSEDLRFRGRQRIYILEDI